MKDLAVKEPWQGSGADPRSERWADEDPKEEDDDDNDESGEDIDRSKLPCRAFRFVEF